MAGVQRALISFLASSRQSTPKWFDEARWRRPDAQKADAIHLATPLHLGRLRPRCRRAKRRNELAQVTSLPVL
jgi:hypothetical protein